LVAIAEKLAAHAPAMAPSREERGQIRTRFESAKQSLAKRPKKVLAVKAKWYGGELTPFCLNFWERY